MFKLINIDIKKVFDELKLDIKFIFNEIIHIPSMNALKHKYKDYNPVFKFFIPFMYINIPVLQLIVISSASYYIYKMYVHFSSGSLASTLLEIIGISLYLTSMGLFVRKYIKLNDTQERGIELLGLFIISVFICVLIIYFNFPISFLLFVPFFLAKYFFKHYSNVKFSPRDKFKNAVVQTVYAQSDRIKDLYAKKMFVSGFYSEFVLKQWLVVVIYSLVNTDVHESVLILHYGIMHIGFNICNRTIGVLFGNPRGVSFSTILEYTAATVTLLGSGVAVRAGYIDDYSQVTAQDGEVKPSFFGDAMTRHHQNEAGYDFNYTDKVGRDFSHAARHSSSEFTEKYLLNSEGELCSQSPIGSEGRVIDAGKTDECLTQNNITIKESAFGVKRFVKVLDETTTFGSLFNNEFSVNNDNEDFK